MRLSKTMFVFQTTAKFTFTVLSAHAPPADCRLMQIVFINSLLSGPIPPSKAPFQVMPWRASTDANGSYPVALKLNVLSNRRHFKIRFFLHWHTHTQMNTRQPVERLADHRARFAFPSVWSWRKGDKNRLGCQQILTSDTTNHEFFWTTHTHTHTQLCINGR